MAVILDSTYMNDVWDRLTRGRSELQTGIMRDAVASTFSAALQRLGDRVAADDNLYPLLMRHWDLTLVGGQVQITDINTLTPPNPIVLTTGGRKRIRVTMDSADPSVKLTCKYVANYSDLLNPPPIPDPNNRYYTFWDQSLVIRDSQAQIPTETAVQLFGVASVLVGDEIDLQLYDNVVDIGCALVMESQDLAELIRQAEIESAVQPALPGTPSGG